MRILIATMVALLVIPCYVDGKRVSRGYSGSKVHRVPTPIVRNPVVKPQEKLSYERRVNKAKTLEELDEILKEVEDEMTRGGQISENTLLIIERLRSKQKELKRVK